MTWKSVWQIQLMKTSYFFEWKHVENRFSILLSLLVFLFLVLRKWKLWNYGGNSNRTFAVMMSFVPITPNNHTHKHHGSLHRCTKNKQNYTQQMNCRLASVWKTISFLIIIIGVVVSCSLLRNPFPSLISNTINFTITIFLLLGYEHCIGYRIYVRKYKISKYISIYKEIYIWIL